MGTLSKLTGRFIAGVGVAVSPKTLTSSGGLTANPGRPVNWSLNRTAPATSAPANTTAIGSQKEGWAPLLLFFLTAFFFSSLGTINCGIAFILNQKDVL